MAKRLLLRFAAAHHSRRQLQTEHWYQAPHGSHHAFVGGTHQKERDTTLPSLIEEVAPPLHDSPILIAQ